MATATQTKQSQTFAPFTAMVELPREAALATLNAALQTQEATNTMVRNLIEVGFSTQEAGARLTRECVGNLFNAQQEWVRKASEMTGNFLSATTSLD